MYTADMGASCWPVIALLLIVLAGAGLALPDSSLAAPVSSAGTIAGGGDQTCTVTSAGGVMCWGSNDHGQLGDGTTANRAEPVAVSGLSGIARVAAGLSFSCAVRTTGALSCWGGNDSGQLGDGTTTDRATPVPVSGLASGVRDIALGSGHACAVTSTGGVQCWGDNLFGQLGDGTTTSHSTPADVTGLTSGVVAVASGGFSSCVLTSAGGVKCWGDNTFGQLGDGTTIDRDVPVDVTGLASGVVAIGAGRAGHACAALESGGLKCWGNNEYGQLGENRSCPTPCVTPVDAQGLTDQVTAITAGYFFTCALTSGGGVKCWGNNQFGQLGDGQACGLLCGTPQNVTGLGSGATEIAAGWRHACARASSGVLCWGDNFSGQLGDGGQCGTLCPGPVPVTGAGGFAPGDANCDHATNSIDSAVVLQFVAGLIGTLPCMGAADVNGDHLVNAVDAALILQYEAGLIHRLPP
jgi:alpha-tubulin suppressor-like RCC1 family protein